MNWKQYSHLSDTHAFLSPSRYHWLNYSSEKLIKVYENHKRISLGNKYHALAAKLIELAVRLPKNNAALNSFVNDAIGFRMQPEQVLYYSHNCYGTADAISYNDGVLRIHDLKTGITPGSMSQVLVYAALFSLDYKEEPKDIHLRIYQSNEVVEYNPPWIEIRDIMDTIIAWDDIINEFDQRMIL